MKTETIEGNALIAEFMGWVREQSEIDWKSFWYPPNCPKDNLERLLTRTRADGFKYHSSWDWLMPVVEKIGGYEISENHCWISKDWKEIANKEANTTIQAVYLAVVEFIKFHTQQK